ncbi:hypothetical protein JRQ81_011145 [Phrynocephalus forsythii]|uniref:Cysteine-rich and transmembrane domain-containing protein 1 n=1 Tax=Phrynocephalus forsythii TaxID=171643 RepID=A0A9Q1B5G5_9SAUR|nr:hypothetical protein JRQ81_011145 [Phrynocephalus forsythii]
MDLLHQENLVLQKKVFHYPDQINTRQCLRRQDGQPEGLWTANLSKVEDEVACMQSNRVRRGSARRLPFGSSSSSSSSRRRRSSGPSARRARGEAGGKHLASYMNQEHPPPYPGPGPTAPYPPYTQQPIGPPGPGPYPGYPVGPPGPYGSAEPGYQGYPAYGWQNAPPPPGPVYADGPKNTVYVVEERRRDDTGESACLTACWTALCCCCLWDMLT